jgi:MFS superfamily sulfate permease-like transporter
MIPLASLACILILVGYKLANPGLFKEMLSNGSEQFLPFIATILGMVFLDLLTGVTIGLIFSVLFILKNSFHNPYKQYQADDAKHEYLIVLAQEVTFLNKEKILRNLDSIPEDSKVVIDGSKSEFIHYDILEIIENFKIHAKSMNISLTLKGIKL